MVMDMNFGDGEGVKKRERIWEKNSEKKWLVYMVFLVRLVNPQNCGKWEVYIDFASEWTPLDCDPSKRFING